jgi:D-alanine-D-alanine ligase
MQVAVLAGGQSPEHEVSLASATQVLKHLDRARFRVRPVFLDRQGRWWPARSELPAGASWRRDPGDLIGPMRPGQALTWLLDEAGIDVVLPVLHGPFGEDGTVQGMLELHGVPFVGSGCAASAVAMDKLRSRQALHAAGVPQPRAYVPEQPLAGADARREFQRLRSTIGTPAFVKVDASGSTVGVARIEDEEQLAAVFAQFRSGFRRWYAGDRRRASHRQCYQ